MSLGLTYENKQGDKKMLIIEILKQIEINQIRREKMKTSTLQIRLSPIEKKLLQDYAKKKNMTMSKVIVQLIYSLYKGVQNVND